MTRRPGLLAVLAILAASAAAAGPRGTAAPRLQGSWEEGLHRLADVVTLEIRVPMASADFFIEGDLQPGSTWGDALVVGVQQTPPQSFPGDVAVKVRVQVFATGSVALPPANLIVHTAGSTERLDVGVPPLSITPLLPQGDVPPPPPLPPVEIPSPLLWWPWVLAALVAAGAGAYFVLRRRTVAIEPKPRPTLRETDPDAWIRAELERIFRESIPLSERYASASNRIRDYLELRFGLPFLEWTTGEVREGLSLVPDLPQRAAMDLASALTFCDLVVFARHKPSPEEETAFASNVAGALSALPPRQREAAA